MNGVADLARWDVLSRLDNQSAAFLALDEDGADVVVNFQRRDSEAQAACREMEAIAVNVRFV